MEPDGASQVIKKVKREYSKGGCRECKRRKIKCSEHKPQCWQCERLMKVCSYPKSGERVLRISKKQLGKKIAQVDSQGNHPTIQHYKHGTASKDKKKSMGSTTGFSRFSAATSSFGAEEHREEAASNKPQKFHGINQQEMEANVQPKYAPSSIISLLNDSNTPLLSDSENQINSTESSAQMTMNSSQSSLFQQSKHFESPNNIESSHTFSTNNHEMNSNDILLYGNQYHCDVADLNILATDLNNLVNDIMFESNFDKNVVLNQEMESLFNPLISNSNEAVKLNTNEVRIPRNIPLDYIKVTNVHEKLYLEEFYNDFANIILPFSSYDMNLKEHFNPARDIILLCASNESFLLAAIMAQGAKTLFNKNQLPEDEEAYVTYLSKCLKLLDPVLSGSGDMKDGPELQSNIEVVLITVLLLTSANASNVKQDWRPHLRGAKDLLLKISTKKIRSSKILIFCKSWFVSFEILAGLSSKIGGTLRTDHELDLLITPADACEFEVLEELGIIDSSGFNIMGGYHNSCFSYFRDLIKILNKFRKLGPIFVPEDSSEYLRLLSELYKQSQIEFVSKKCILSTSDFPNKQVPNGKLLDIIEVKDGKIIISWMDTSHQAYVIGSIITILTKCLQLPYCSPTVQDLVNRLIHLVSFLNRTTEMPQQMIKCSMMMIQWPMLVAGMNCINEDNKYVLMKFFRISAQIGSGSAKFSLKKLAKIWSIHEMGGKADDSDEELDILSY